MTDNTANRGRHKVGSVNGRSANRRLRIIGVLKCVEERKRVNRRLTVTIKLIANYVIED